MAPAGRCSAWLRGGPAALSSLLCTALRLSWYTAAYGFWCACGREGGVEAQAERMVVVRGGRQWSEWRYGAEGGAAARRWRQGRAARRQLGSNLRMPRLGLLGEAPLGGRLGSLRWALRCRVLLQSVRGMGSWLHRLCGAIPTSRTRVAVNARVRPGRLLLLLLWGRRRAAAVHATVAGIGAALRLRRCWGAAVGCTTVAAGSRRVPGLLSRRCMVCLVLQLGRPGMGLARLAWRVSVLLLLQRQLLLGRAGILRRCGVRLLLNGCGALLRHLLLNGVCLLWRLLQRVLGVLRVLLLLLLLLLGRCIALLLLWLLLALRICLLRICLLRRRWVGTRRATLLLLQHVRCMGCTIAWRCCRRRLLYNGLLLRPLHGRWIRRCCCGGTIAGRRDERVRWGRPCSRRLLPAHLWQRRVVLP